MADRLETFGYVRAHDEDTRRVTVVVSTGDIARDGAIINQAGWDLRNYERNPVVLWGHDDSSLPIARAVETITSEDEMLQVHEFAAHPRAEEVFQAIRGRFVNATSVRWTPGETVRREVNGRNVLVFERGHELLEVSYVPIPADPGSLVVRADGRTFDAADFDPNESFCCAKDCRNPAPIAYTLCDDCSDLLDTARAQRAATPQETHLSTNPLRFGRLADALAHHNALAGVTK